MLVREIVYYYMSNEQLHKEITRLRFKLENETDVKKKMKYLHALSDAIKALIRKYRNDEVFMEYVTFELNKLRAQIKEVL